MEHRNPEYGSLATECTRCHLEFYLQVDHAGWKGIGCKPTAWLRSELAVIQRDYSEFHRRRANAPVH